MQTSKSANSRRDWFGTLKVIIQALALALIIRTFFFQAFSIPSGSMKSTLLIGDHLLVAKYSYGYSRHSFPIDLLPFSGRLFSRMPRRGDVVVFKTPEDNRTDYIKRVIGLPGDEIQVVSGILHINGAAVERTQIEDFIESDTSGSPKQISRYTERLPNGVSYEVLDQAAAGPLDNTPIYRVPEGHFFMMGDNRDRSSDSRIPTGVGYVPFENLIGKAKFVFFSNGDDKPAWQIWNWPFSVRFERTFRGL
ncbi:signal peptidase I [Roseibium sp.]|uniref:signal peptidase I n=1 Tax=Roseibium sp. TaxID=1936156 RepID=UPI003267107F